MRKFTQRVLISGAAEMAIIGASVVSTCLEAQADPTPCVSATGLCEPQQMNGPQLRMVIICQPTGPKAGAYCQAAHTLPGRR